jgi:hypothetical protein
MSGVGAATASVVNTGALLVELAIPLESCASGVKDGHVRFHLTFPGWLRARAMQFKMSETSSCVFRFRRP